MATKAAAVPAERKAEPGEMKRGKLFRLDKGWVLVLPGEVDKNEATLIQDWWSRVSSDPLIFLQSTDLLVGEEGRLVVRDVALAFPEEDPDAS